MIRTLARLAYATFLVALTLSAAPHALAQTSDEINAGIQFDFSLPGARSLSMGGAFVAIANDATTAYSNPAGLTNLLSSEVSVEGRVWNFFSIIPDKGHGFGPPSGFGIDTIMGVLNLEIEDTNGSPAFLSFVYVPENSKLRLAVFRHQLSNYSARIQSEGPFASAATGEIGRNVPLLGRLDLDIANWGVSTAYQVHPTLSIGGGIGIFTFDIDSLTQRFALAAPDFAVGGGASPVIPPDNTDPGTFFGPADFTDPNLRFANTSQGEDTQVAVNVGMLWTPRPDVSIGASFRQGPDFDYVSEFFNGPAEGSPGTVRDRDDVIFHVPDAFSAGAALRPNDWLTVSVEYNFVRYKQLIDGAGDGKVVEIAGLLDNEFNQNQPPDIRAALNAQGEEIRNNTTIDNAHQARFGAEILLPTSFPLFIRGGTWFDPDHRVRFEGLQIPGSARSLAGEDEWHVSMGAGVRLPIQTWEIQLDGAVDISDRVNTIAISSVFYLGSS